jgi:hypothetical protein
LKSAKRTLEVFHRRIAEKLFEKSDDQFDLRTFQTASTAMQCFAKVGKFIALAQFISDIPSYGPNDKKMGEMTAFEEFKLLRRKLSHAEDYP